MSLLTILSRVAGLLRDKACSYFLGVGTVWSAFWMGFQLPNLFRRIFGEGALTAVFVPVYTRTLEQQGRDAANRLASSTATLLVLVLGGITLLAEVALVPIALTPGVSANNRLAAAMVAIMLPYCVLVCLVALLGAIASVHEKFAAQSLSPVVLNFFMAGAAALPVALYGSYHQPQQRIYWVAGAVIIAGGVQVLLMLPTMLRSGVSLRPLLAIRNTGLGEIIRAMLPMMIGLSAVQINTLLDTQIAWWLSPDGHRGASDFCVFGWQVHTPMQAGAAGILSVAQRIYMLPVGIFGVSMAVAIFPLLSKAAAGKDIAELKRLLALGLRKTLFLSIPASAGMIVIGKPLITLIFMGGHTHEGDIDRAYWASIWFCLGIWAFEAQLVIVRVYYALQDSRTPMRVALAMVGLNFGLNVTLIWFLREGGIALSTTIAAIVQSAILLGLLRGRLGRLGLGDLGKSVLKGAVATLIMLEACWAAAGVLQRVLPDLAHATRVQRIWMLALAELPVLVLTAGMTYALVAYLLGMEEVGSMPVLGRLFRRR